MGREAMNAAPRSGRRRRSSKDPMAKKLDAKEKPSASHPLKELYKGSFPPSIGASGFRFFDSSSKESLAGSKTATGNPQSAPPNARSVAFNSKITAKDAGARTSQKDASKSDLEVPSKIGSTKFSKRAAAADLLRKRSKKDPFPKIDLEPAVADEAKQMSTTTPPSSATPPVQASVSPEVPVGSSLVTPACFAAGHVIVGVHDRRKCRPRGILSVGRGRELEIPEFNGGVADPTRVSATPPPPADASIHWLSSPSEASSRARAAHRLAEASIDRDEIVIETRNAPDHGESLGLNSPWSETTPSSVVMLLRTPTSGDSGSPFSSILERIEKASGSKHHEPRRQSGNSLVDDLVTSATSLCSCSTKNDNLCEPRPQRHNATRQTTFSGFSFQFGSIETSSNSVERLVPGDQARISWRRGLVSRIYRWQDRARLMSEYMESNGGDVKNPEANVEEQNGHLAAAGFGSVEFVFEAETTGAEGPPIRGPGPISSSAESISMEGILLAASDDSDWTFSCKNQLF